MCYISGLLRTFSTKILQELTDTNQQRSRIMNEESTQDSWQLLEDGVEQCGKAVGELIDENQEFCQGAAITAAAITGLWLLTKLIF